MQAEYTSKIYCIPGSMTQKNPQEKERGKGRSKSSNAVQRNGDNIFPVTND